MATQSDPETGDGGGWKYVASHLSRGQWVYDRLRQDIRDGKHGVGSRIREEEVARALGVSRTPVREALSRLQARGLLELTPFGLVVPALSRQQVIELYAMREILEGSAARFAAQHAVRPEITALYRLAAEFEKALGNPAKLAHLNRELHNAIYDAAHNRYLIRTLLELQDTLALLPGTTFSIGGRAEEGVEEHNRIIAAIERRDPDLAEREARLHVARAQENRLQLMLNIA